MRDFSLYPLNNKFNYMRAAIKKVLIICGIEYTDIHDGQVFQ